MAHQVNASFTPAEVDKAFHRLMGALRAGKLYPAHPSRVHLGMPELAGLPDNDGGVRDTPFKDLAKEFMLMHSEVVHNAECGPQTVYGFKHSNTRNYLFVAMRGRPAAFVPITPEPFMRGQFGT